jgi:hypothetical protein
MIFAENTAPSTQIIDLRRKKFLNKGVTKSQSSKYWYTRSSSWPLACDRLFAYYAVYASSPRKATRFRASFLGSTNIMICPSRT